MVYQKKAIYTIKTASSGSMYLYMVLKVLQVRVPELESTFGKINCHKKYFR